MTDEPDDESADHEATNHDDTVPHVELGLYQLTVKVSGQSSDDLTDVEDSAKRLLNYLVEKAETLEEAPDNRGLG